MRAGVTELDHASIRVGSFPRAVEAFTAWFGQPPVRSPGDLPHARVLVDGAYVELREEPPPPGVALWFLRYTDADATRARLQQEGFTVSPTREYRGVDGVWEELHLEPPEGLKHTLLAPILVKRILPVEIARNWPPPPAAHPFGEVRLQRVLMDVASPGAADWLTRLAGEGVSCRVVPDAPPRCRGLQFSVSGFDRLTAHLAFRGIVSSVESREVWVGDAEGFGLQLGFTEARGGR